MGNLSPGEGAIKMTRNTTIKCERTGNTWACSTRNNIDTPQKWIEIGKGIDTIKSTAIDQIKIEGKTMYIDVSRRSFCTVDETASNISLHCSGY
jgi:hypothetical protein